MSNDAIVLLKEDHKKVKALFRQLEQRKDDAGPVVADLTTSICNELLVHAAIEEEIFYPLARKNVQEELVLLEADEEHHMVDVLIKEIQVLEPTHEHFIAKCIVLKDMVLHHIEEEEGEIFPQVREAVGRARLQEIGEQMMTRKKQLQQEPMLIG
jgi:hemerythrin superfamily protein